MSKQTSKASPKVSPKVSIGLPVYNGERYLAAAIDSVLAQTLDDFELIIVDNASTDATGTITRRHAACDARIRYVRNATNLGAAPNFNRAFQLATGAYFKWLAADDLIEPDYLMRTVAALDADPEAVLCTTKVGVIDEEGRRIDSFDIPLRTDSVQPTARFYDLLMVWHNCFDIFGLIRTAALAQTPLIGSYVAGDSVLLARLGLQGRFVTIPDFLFLSRRHAEQSNQMHATGDKRSADHHAYTAWFDASKAGQFMLPQWEILQEYNRSINEAPLSIQERMVCRLYLARWAVRYRQPLLTDLRMAAAYLRRRTLMTAPG